MEIKPFKRPSHSPGRDELNYTDSEIYGRDSRRKQSKMKTGKSAEMQPLVGSLAVKNRGELEAEKDIGLSMTDSEIYRQERRYKRKKKAKIFEMQPLISEQKEFKDNRQRLKSGDELRRRKHMNERNEKVLILAADKIKLVN